MIKFKKYSDLVLEKIDISKATDLFKVYLAVKRSSGHRWWTYKGFAADNFFLQITEENIKDFKVDSELPILSYSTDIIKRLLDSDKIKRKNIINKPEFIKLSGSKEDFHKFIGEDENMPNTVFTKKEAFNLKFPIIAKPSAGHSGLGIQVFYKPEELEKSDENKFNLYSEFVDKKEEHRFFNYKSKPIFWMQRIPMNDKAKNGKGKADEQTMFQYIKRNVDDIPEDMKAVLVKFCNKMKDLPYICFDIMRDKDDKIYIIESNSQPGVPFDSTIVIYRTLFKDFYGRPVNEETDKALNKYSEVLIKKTLSKDKGRFKDESMKTLNQKLKKIANTNFINENINMKKIFLGGTCNDSKWRDELVKKLTIKYFNPVVKDWTPECQAEEIHQRRTCDYCLYVITPRMMGVYSIAEVVDDSNKKPGQTIFCYLTKDSGCEPFSDSQIKSLEQVGKMVLNNGGMFFKSLDEISNYVNNAT